MPNSADWQKSFFILLREQSRQVIENKATEFFEKPKSRQMI
jgi:hypothetical protein